MSLLLTMFGKVLYPYSSIIQFLAKWTLEGDPTARVQADKDAHQWYEYELNVAEDDGGR